MYRRALRETNISDPPPYGMSAKHVCITLSRSLSPHHCDIVPHQTKEILASSENPILQRSTGSMSHNFWQTSTLLYGAHGVI